MIERSRWPIYLRLGRVSNLPTVWTNCMAGAVLAAHSFSTLKLFTVLGALTLFYSGGMFLNDAFDHRLDRRFRPERPIPSGEIRVSRVYAIGFALLASGEALLLLAKQWEAAAWGMALGALIIYYNYVHKRSSLSPLLMALCRGLIYLIAAGGVANSLQSSLLIAAVLLACYIAGLSYIAKQENLAEVKRFWPLILLFAPSVWPWVRPDRGANFGLVSFLFLLWVVYSLSFLWRANKNMRLVVTGLIAGISLLDAWFISSRSQNPELVWLSVGGFLLTLAFQRYIPGT